MGLVDELIQQFADPLAFYRELVQNSIDAGATSIGVTVSFEPDPGNPGEGSASISVRDDGSGMGREVIEGQLTVLFRSGKEEQEGKIGKFGVGFVSVLGLAPTRVVVRSSEGKGPLWTMHLYPDKRYELFRAEGGGSSGTTVTLEVRMTQARFAAFIEGSERALVTWCRHVEVPLRFVARATGVHEPLREVRIDRPFGLDGVLLSVEAEEGTTRVVAGLPKDGQAYTGYFNRGLLLHETPSDLFGAVAVKIRDAQLEHTLSRDNVRRDPHYERAMRFARTVVKERLAARAKEMLAALAEGGRGEPAIDVLLHALEHAGLDAHDGLALPLLHPRGAARAAPLRWLTSEPAYGARRTSALTEAVAARGGLVLDLRVAASPAGYLRRLSALAGRPIERIGEALTLATELAPSGSDLAMLEAFVEVLKDARRAPSNPRLVRLEGKLAGHALYLTGEPGVLEEADARRDPFRWIARPSLLLVADAPVVARAREAAVEAPAFAGAMLARAVLLEHGSLDEAGDDKWLAAAVDRVAG